MALNEAQFPGWNVVVTKASVAAGDPVVLGAITGVSDNGTVTLDGVANQCVLNTGPTIRNYSVKGVVSGPANSAVAQGDAIYISPGHTPVLDKDTGGTLFGYALDTVGSGLTATIRVRHASL